MNSSILTTLLPILLKFWWIFAIAIIAGICRLPLVKGWIGEFLVNFIAKISLNKKTYHLIKNVTIPTENGTTQIDHIIVSKYGIFVVETKNYKGWIFGREKQKEWTQQIYKVKNKFQNPLRQNYKHTKTLEKLLEIAPDKIFSVIVFIGGSIFKTKMPENVTKGIGYVRYIKSKKDILFSEEEVANIISIISSGRLRPSLKTHFQHTAHVKEIIKSKKDNHSRFMPGNNNLSNFESKKENHVISEQHDQLQNKVPAVTNNLKETEEYSIKAPNPYCPKCKELRILLSGPYGYYWKCTSCNENESIRVSCPNCKTKMKIHKNKNEYSIKCDSCDVQGHYYKL